MYKITKNIAPNYLCDRVTFHNNLHNYNTQHRNEIWTPFARSTMRSKCFFIDIAKEFNTFSRHENIEGISKYTFHSKCKKYLLNKEKLLVR